MHDDASVTLWQRLDQLGRSLAPAAVTVLLVVLSMEPLILPGFDQIAPEFALMSVYFWAIHRPDLMGQVSVFAIGLMQDMLAGTPLGMTALVFVLCHWMVVSQRGFFLASSFVMLWAGFTIVVLGATAVQWVCCSLLSQAFFPLQAPLVQALVTLALFPVAAWGFIRMYWAFLVREP